jgi:hypothetical protein
VKGAAVKILTPWLAAVGLLALLLAPACGPAPKACLRPGYQFLVVEPDGSPATEAEVSFRPVIVNTEDEVTAQAGREVVIHADSAGKVIVGPLREDTVQVGKGLRLATQIVVAMPDGRRAETFHHLGKKTKCTVLRAPPIPLQTADETESETDN